jgi:hypothetical protein
MSDNSGGFGTQGLMTTDFFKLGTERTGAMLGLQKELLDAYQQASGALLARVNSEADLWSGLAAKLTSTRSVPEALTAYQEGIAQRMQMGADDGRKLAEDAQKIMTTIAKSLPNGWGAKA